MRRRFGATPCRRRALARTVSGAVFGAILAAGSSVSAQEALAIRSDFLFYGDNTEFHNLFRDGETIFGVAARVSAEIALSDRVVISGGAFANQRFGSEMAFEQVRPVIALTITGRRSAFSFGTLPPASRDSVMGPDNGGPHALLPALQRETLAFERPYEAGFAWTFKGSRLDHHFWLTWQKLNTVEHRERFDGGLRTSFRVTRHLSVPLQLHIVHEGGQLHASGPVADSGAAAAGVNVTRTLGGYRTSVELLAAASRHVPDRALVGHVNGAAFFGRVAAERDRWRTHVIFWRGRDFLKDEGDPNYLSVFQDGRAYRGTRDYSEAGLTRRFTLAPGAVLDVSGRLHRVEGRYEYSYRIRSVVSALWKLR